MDFIFRAAEKFLKDHKRLMRYRRVFAVLAAVVVFATTYELILPAITIDRQRAAETPGIEVGVAAEETVESDGMEESVEEKAEAEAQAEAEAEAEAEAAAKAQAEAEAEAEATAAEEADAAVAEGDSQTDTAEAEEEAQSKSEEANAAAASSDADISGETISQDTEETADGGNSDQDNADSDAAIAEDETVSQYTGEDSDSTDPAADGSADTAEEENTVTDAAAAGTTAAAEQAIEYPVTLTFEGEDYTITATFDEAAKLPAGVTLDALEILPDMIYKDADGNVLYDDYEVYLEKTVETLEKDNRLEDTCVASARFFDITFINQKGYYVEPAAPVTVAVKYKEALSAEDTVNTVAVHFDDKKDKTEIIETEEEVKNKAIKEISFDAEKFSIYGLAATQKLETKELTASDDTYEISVSYNQKAEIPEGAKLEAYELMPGTEEYEECAAKSANTDENGETASRFFNISIMVDGAEYEPKAAVDVKITLKDTAPEEVAADKEITHFTNDGDVENIPQEVEKASDGGAEVSFQMDSFSTVEVPLLGSSSTSDYTITVGGTVEINGTSSYSSNSWESSDTAIATVSDSSTNTETVTGVSAGTATITHTYYVSKKKTATETYTVKVESASNQVTDSEATAEEFSENGFTVTVKDTGNLKKLSDYRVVVEDVDNNHTEVDDFLKAYHIYLVDGNGDSVEDSSLLYNGQNLNLQVTLTYTTLPEWFTQAKDIKHFKEKDGDAQYIGNIKIDKSAKAVTFIVHGFSEIILTGSSSSSTSGWTPTVAPDLVGTINTDNEWQIDSLQYGSTSSSSTKFVYDSTGKQILRLQKTVIPTEVENEFKVYLNAEPVGIHDWVNIFLGSGIMIVNNNCEWEDDFTFSPDDSCTTVAGILGINTHCSYLVSSSESMSDQNTYKGDIKKEKTVNKIVLTTSDGSIELDVSMHYWLNQNSTSSFTIVYCPKNGTKTYKLSNVSYSNGTLTFPVEAYKAIVEGSSEIFDNMIQLVTPESVYDVMGDNIEYLGVDGMYPSNGAVTESTDTSTGNQAITWTLGTSDITDYVALNPDDEESDYYYVNAYQLVYKIRLKMESDSYTSNTVVDTNDSATMTYREYESTTDKTAAYYKPTVHGRRYQIRVRKLDENGGPLSGAKFKITSLEGTEGVSTATVLNYDSSEVYTTDANGYFIVNAELVGLEEGTYIPTSDDMFSGKYKLTLQETVAPERYATINSDKVTDLVVSIGNYTNNSSDFTENSNNTQLLVYTGANGLQAISNEGSISSITTDSSITIVDTPINVAILKVDNSTSANPLESAGFSLTPSGGTAITGQTDRDGYLYFKNVAAGTYTLTETAEPDGYDKTFASATITVNDDGSVTVSGVVDDEGESVSGMVVANGTVAKTDTGENARSYAVIKVVNTSSEVSLLLRKTGQDSNALPGATLSIKNNGTEALTTDQINAIVSNGYSTISLMPGTEYVISESKAPAGYKKLESDITFKLVADETSQIGYILTDSNGNELTDSMLSISKEDNTVVLRLKNDQGAVLPNTGGTGFLSPMTLCGIMAMAFVLATAVMYGFSLRRGERRYK